MEKDIRIAKAVAELAEAFEFVMHLHQLKPEQAMDEIEEKYPEFIERFEAMENVDEEDFLIQFCYWVLNKRFREKYPDIWEKVKYAYTHSSIAHRQENKFLMEDTMKRQIEEILRAFDFPQE